MSRFERPRHIAIGVGTIGAALVIASCSATPGGNAAAKPVTVTATVARTVVSTSTMLQTMTPPTVTVTETDMGLPDSDTPTTADTSGALPTDLSVGGPGITASNDNGGSAIDVLSVSRKNSGTGGDSEPPKYGNYILIDVSYLCTNGTWDYNPFDWQLRDSSGRTYDTGSAYSSGYDATALNSGTLGNGAKARGLLIFDAPKTALTLEYSAGFGGAPATWTIPA